MRRFVSIWLPAWPIERLRRAQTQARPAATWPEARPLALVTSGARGLRITAANAAALAEGVRPGLALADARAAFPGLATRPAEPGRDGEALIALARWAGRYGPNRHVDGDDGLWVDTTGVAHLYGGEVRLLRDLHSRLSALGLTARIALAATHGGAHALARYATAARRPFVLISDEGLAAALAPLPVAALRLDDEAVRLARRLGLKRVGDLYDLPRESLALRFRAPAAVSAAEALMARLDAALGHRPEPRESLVEAPVLAVQQSFAEPLISADGLAAAVTALAGKLVACLDATGQGLRRARLALYRADATSSAIVIGTAAPVRSPEHILALLAGKLETLDAGFGIDLLTFEALSVEALGARQEPLAAAAGVGASAMLDGSAGGGAVSPALVRLVDRLANRLGSDRVVAMAVRPSHLPERAEQRWALIGSGAGGVQRLGVMKQADEMAFARGRRPPPRPALLFETPEPIAVMAEVPDGPPLRFTWRRVEHRVVRAEGPERIEAEWWRSLAERWRPPAGPAEESSRDVALGQCVPPPARHRPRDYYRIEDQAGGRYWVFRGGLYGRGEEEGAPGWFMHGLYG